MPPAQSGRGKVCFKLGISCKNETNMKINVTDYIMKQEQSGKQVLFSRGKNDAEKYREKLADTLHRIAYHQPRGEGFDRTRQGKSCR